MKLKSNQEKTEKTDKRVCTLSETIQDLLIRQLQHELYNHNLYRTFANWFGIQGFAVLEKYYIERAEEEKLHHDWIYNYLNTCDVIFSYPEIPAVKEIVTNNIEPFEFTVDVEIETTQLIDEIAKQAFEECDWATFKWLNGDSAETGMLILEQIEEESLSRAALDIAREEGSWLRKEKSIMNLYTGDLN